jgi:putative ABC transport system ATP-binding protein
VTVIDPILLLKHVFKEYPGPRGPIHVLSGINLLISASKLTVMLGRSGAGKSTLLNLMGALETPSGGSIIFEGVDLAGLENRQLTLIRRRRIGFVFQFFNLLPHLPVWQNIALPLLIDGVHPSKAHQKAEDLADRLQLTDRLDVATGFLSGGEMQRVALARALSHDPAMILADEPTGNLDQTTGHIILELLRELVDRDGRTIVMATHDADGAALADHLVRLVDGRIVEERSTLAKA